MRGQKDLTHLSRKVGLPLREVEDAFQVCHCVPGDFVTSAK